LFTKELESALLNGTIDLAVHSLKDLPTEDARGLRIGAIPRRADWRDVLVTKGAEGLEHLTEGSTVATGSPRRVKQLLRARPNLKVSDIRGNIDTRLRKLRENDTWSGLVLAAAGLERLKPDLSGLTLHFLESGVMLPAPGQGALGLQIRADDTLTLERVQTVHDPVTAACVRAERAFLQGLGGGCSAPAGALALALSGTHLEMKAISWLPVGDDWVIGGGEGEASFNDAHEFGIALAARILEGG
jgi:hydroxymethylbilane synthase